MMNYQGQQVLVPHWGEATWTPAAPIGGNLPVLWMESSGITGLSDNDAVPSWVATIGGVSAVQATPTKQPSYQTNEWNGKPTVSFDGGDLLRIAGTVSTATSGTLFVVFSIDNRTGDVTVLGSFDEGTATFWYILRISSGRVAYLCRNGAVFSNTLLTNNPYTGMPILYPATGKPHLITVQSDDSAITLRIDGVEHTLTVSGGANDGSWIGDVPNRDNFVLGAFKASSEAQFLTGDEGSILLYDAVLSPTNIRTVEDFYNKFYGISQIIFDGNSMTLGTGSTGRNDYPVLVADALVGSYVHQNFGISGQTTATMITNATTRIDPLYSSSRPKNIVVVWEGTNDLFFGATAAVAYARLVSYCEARQAAGWKVVILTILPRSNVGTPADFEASRQTVNTSIRANWATFADALADVAANTDIGEAGDETDATYYTDLVHMTNAGYTIVAGIAATAIATL